MPKKAKKLTDNLVALYSSSVPKNSQGEIVRRKAYADGEVSGLYLEVRFHNGNQPSSIWLFRQQKTSKNTGGKYTLGEYPKLNLSSARSKALLLKSQLCCGVTPEKAGFQKELTSVFTLQTASDLWFSHAEKIKHYKKPCYAHKEKQRFNANVISYIGNIPLENLTLQDICRAFEHCWDKEATRDRSLGTLRNAG